MPVILSSISLPIFPPASPPPNIAAPPAKAGNAKPPVIAPIPTVSRANVNPPPVPISQPSPPLNEGTFLGSCGTSWRTLREFLFDRPFV